MDYAHLSRIKIITPDEALKLRFDSWVEAQKRPYAKLMSGFYKTKYLVSNLKESGIDFANFASPPEIEPEVDLDKESKFNLEPARDYCEGAFFNPKSFVYPPYYERTQKSIKKDTAEQVVFVGKLSLEVEKLHQLGCPIIFPHKNRHRCEIDDPSGKFNYFGVEEFYLFMPLQKPNSSFGHETIGMPPQPRTLPNFEGQVTFLAYLMRKGYVTEADAPRGENPAAPFSASMFGFAKTRAKTLALET